MFMKLSRLIVLCLWPFFAINGWGAGVGIPVSDVDMAATVEEIVEAAEDIENPESAAVFNDIRELERLLSELNWENSDDQTKRDLYSRLKNIITEIKQSNKETVEEFIRQQKVEEAREYYESAKENEQSTANKLLGGASMAAMGIGGMELASAMSEKKAMEEAEQQMKAYLATFSCTYDDGKRFSGGETAIELPGGNELLSLVGEYKTLAADLKLRKEALGLKPGIESQEILDKANSGLYDDVATGKTDGAFTSLARALSDKTSEDAAEWAEDKAKIEEKVKKAGTAVAVAAVASVAANLAINGGQNKRKSVAEKAKPVRDDVYAVLDEIIKKCNAGFSKNESLQHVVSYKDLPAKIKDCQ